MLTKTLRITNARNAKTLSPSHMKQCIMSENRFDFLRELVKNVPDISVAEEQQAAENLSERNDNAASPLQLTIASTSASTSSNGGDVSHAFNNFRNGKRSHDNNAIGVTSSSNVQWKFSKQYSLDSIAEKLSSTQSPNVSTDSTAPINYSLKCGPNEKHDRHHTPRLLRIDSAPANSQSTYSPTSTTDCFMPITTTSKTAGDRPIINFDFTKVPFLSTASTISNSLETPSTSTSMSQSAQSTTKPSELLPSSDPAPLKLAISSSNSYSVENILKADNKEVNQSTSNISTDSTPMTPSVFKVVDLVNTPLIKIDYSQMNLSNLQQQTIQTSVLQQKQRTVPQKHLPSKSFASNHPSSSSHSRSPPTSITTKSSADAQPTPVISINFNNASATPIISYRLPSTTISNSSTLEMDEDYDNI